MTITITPLPAAPDEPPEGAHVNAGRTVVVVRNLTDGTLVVPRELLERIADLAIATKDRSTPTPPL